MKGPRSRVQGPTPAQIAAAVGLCFADELNDAEIAAQLGVARRTLARWKRRPDFQALYEAADREWERLEAEKHARRREQEWEARRQWLRAGTTAV